MNELGARLQALRRQANLSQQELAERLHVSRQSISKWELGTAKPDLDNMIRLSELFGVSLDELVLGKTQNRQEIPQYSAQPVENAKAKPKETNALVSACRCAVSCAGSCAFAAASDVRPAFVGKLVYERLEVSADGAAQCPAAYRSRIFGCRVLEQILNLSSRDVRPLTNSDCLGYNESRK